jgi:Reverse transcriptase (RNA-dependent DNA polymerase)
MQVRRAKRAFEYRQQEELVQNLYEDPKQFWKCFQIRGKGGGSFTAAEWTEWFETLLRANTAGDLVGGSVESHCTAFADLFPVPGEAALRAADELNREFSVGEVNMAMAGLACNKSAGVDGVPAEFLQQAYVSVPAGPGGQPPASRSFVMAPAITQVFNAVLNGAYPVEWQTSALAPVPKPKGRPDVKDEHRGVAVSPVLGKLYSMVWTNRIDSWAEGQGLRAAGQAGFRRGRGTQDWCFVLRHMLDVAKVQGKATYCAFVDFSKAYDRVSRPLLLRVLASCGMHGRAMHAIATMLEVTRLQVRAGGQLGVPFDSTVGVKQGDPASPVFFGIFIDRLEAYLTRHCTGPGVQLGMKVLRALLYADDVVLMSETAEGLQEMLDRLAAFCTANSMFVNERKSEVVVFGGGGERRPGADRPAAVFSLNGAALATKPSYVYLGLRYADGVPARAAVKAAVARARKAMYAMFSRCYTLKVHNVNLRCHLFDSLVLPVLNYGCEVWGVDWLSRMCRDGSFASGEAEEIQRQFLRQCLGVCKSTPLAAMYADLNRRPLGMVWLQRAAQLWNRALSREDPDDWLGIALRENVRWAGDNAVPLGRRKSLWAWHFISCLDSLGVQWRSGASGVLLQIDKKELGEAMQRKWEEWGGREVRAATEQSPDWSREVCAVRAAPESFSKGYKLFVYEKWFAVDKWIRRQHWSFWLHKPEHIRVMAQFRLGSHWLEVQKGRSAGLRRGERCCAGCAGCVEDEMHLMQCPTYADLRSQLLGVVPNTWTDAAMNEYMNKQTEADWRNLAEYLLQCRSRKVEAGVGV